MKTKHTPGPWKASKDEESAFNDWFVELENERHHPIAEMIDTEANARLIAAAPDMLDTLEEVVAMWRLLKKHFGAKADDPDPREIERAKAVIKIAKGLDLENPAIEQMKETIKKATE